MTQDKGNGKWQIAFWIITGFVGIASFSSVRAFGSNTTEHKEIREELHEVNLSVLKELKEISVEVGKIGVTLKHWEPVK